jgi:hypothetical protein
MNGANASTATTEVAWDTDQTGPCYVRLTDQVPRQVPLQVPPSSVPHIHQNHWAVLLTRHFNGETAVPGAPHFRIHTR